MLEGAAWREIGDDDRAYVVVEKIYTRDGRAGFSRLEAGLHDEAIAYWEQALTLLPQKKLFQVHER